MSRKKNEEVEWARDVLAVYKRGTTPPPKSWPESRRALFAWASEEENRKELFTRLTPKAIEVLSKYDSEQAEDEITRAEKRSIADLKATLAEAVKEATK